ncbi:hypothetical protein P3G55_23235 [Leptospira sp. 96542]|nr:hypothetical protein [Leptospira sp. 96542]
MSSDRIRDTDRLLIAIGKVVVQFQFVESVVAEMLASLLQLRQPDDQHRIMAAMSYKQKVDLLFDLYPSRRVQSWPDIDVGISRQALYAAEKYRNTVVHSFWHIGGEESRWMRTKADLRRSNGLRIQSSEVDIESLEVGSQSIYVIRDWYLGQTDRIKSATETLNAGIKAITGKK